MTALGDSGPGTRSAPLYSGNDRVAHPTGSVARANCQSRTIEFVQGSRTFWSASFFQSALADRLGGAMCE